MIHRKVIILMIGLIVALPFAAFGQSNLESVRLFQSYFFDVPVTQNKLVEGDVAFSNYDGGSAFSLGPRGAYPVNEKIEVDAQLHFASMNPDYGDGQSGLTDLGIYGRYFLQKKEKTSFSAGAMLTLPIGSDKIYLTNYGFQSLGASVLNFGAFGAMRHQLANGMVFTANAGLFFYEVPDYSVDIDDSDWDDWNWDDYGYSPSSVSSVAATSADDDDDTKRETSFNLGAGVIYPFDAKLNIVGEFYMMSEGDFMMLSGGADYKLGKGRKVRGMLGLGLDDGAPDFMILAGYELTL